MNRCVSRINFRAISGVIAVATLFASPAVQAAQCLTRTEANGVIAFALPSVITSLEGRCRAVLPKTSALSTLGLDMAAKMKPESDRAWPAAKAAIGKMSKAELPAFLGDSVIRSILEAAITEGMVEEVKPDACPMVDRFINVLSPLPAENLTGLMTLLVEIAMKPETNNNRQKAGPFSVCAGDTQG